MWKISYQYEIPLLTSCSFTLGQNRHIIEFNFFFLFSSLHCQLAMYLRLYWIVLELVRKKNERMVRERERAKKNKTRKREMNKRKKKRMEEVSEEIDLKLRIMHDSQNVRCVTEWKMLS